jgi:hypothetical protein
MYMCARGIEFASTILRLDLGTDPCLQHPCLCVWSVYTRYIITFIFDELLYTWFTDFNICGLSYTSIVVNNNWSSVSFNEVKPESGIE